MESRVRLARHPAHPMLVMLPIAFFPLLVFLDVLYWYFGDAAFWTVGWWVALAGVVTTIVAMVPGIVDLAAIPNESRAHRTALIHLVVGFVLLGLFAAGLWARSPAGSPPARVGLTVAFDIAGLILVGVQGWLGGELVYKHHIGVKSVTEGADPVALEPSSDARAARRTGRERKH